MHKERMGFALLLGLGLLTVSLGPLQAGTPGTPEVKPSSKRVPTAGKPAAVALRSVTTVELERRAGAGDRRAAIALAERFLAQDGEPYQPQRALDLLQKAAEGGDPEARCQLVRTILELEQRKQVQPLSETGRAELAKELERSSKAGWVDATFELGRLRKGLGEQAQDLNAVLAGWQLMVEAERRGSGPASTFLGNYTLESPRESILTEYQKYFFEESAIEGFFLRGIERGDLNAYLGLGDYYSSHAFGRTPDRAKAIAWLEKGTKNGKLQAAVQLADLHMEDGEIPKDPVKAHAWAKWASDRGCAAGSEWLQRQAQIEQRGKESEAAREQQRVLLERARQDRERQLAKADACIARAKELKREGDRLDFLKADLDKQEGTINHLEQLVDIHVALANVTYVPGNTRMANEYKQKLAREVKSFNRMAETYNQKAANYRSKREQFIADCAPE